MKQVLLLLVPLVGAILLWQLFGASEPEAPVDLGHPDETGEPLPDPPMMPGGPMTPEEAERMRARLRLATGTLTVRVRTPDGQVPLSAEVGWEVLGERRWFLATDAGARTLTQIPLGPVKALARAKGFQVHMQPVQVEAGIPAEVTILLSDRRP